MKFALKRLVLKYYDTVGSKVNFKSPSNSRLLETVVGMPCQKQPQTILAHFFRIKVKFCGMPD